MRIVFLGNSPWSVPSLVALQRSSHVVVAVITEPPKPAGRGGAPRATAVAVAARELGVRVIEHAGGPLAPVLADLEPDVVAVVAYGRILPQAALDVATVAPLNLHFSLLPDLRGASPVQSALLRGYRVTGVSVLRMVAALDAGPVYARREVAIDEAEEAGSLGTRLAAIGADLLVEVIDRLADGGAAATPQEDALATTCGKLGPDDRRIRWAEEDAARGVARVRAFAPDPGASTTLRGEGLRVVSALIEDHDGSLGPPGAILRIEGEHAIVAASGGSVRLIEVVPAGRRRMTAGAFLRGARPTAEDRFV